MNSNYLLAEIQMTRNMNVFIQFILIITIPSVFLFGFALTSNNAFALVFGLFWAGLGSLMHGINSIINYRLFSVCRLSAAFLVGFMLLGSVPTHIEHIFYPDMPSYAMSIIFKPETNAENVALVALYFIAFQLFCELFAFFDNPWWEKIIEILRNRMINLNMSLSVEFVFLISCSGLCLYALVSGAVSINASYFESNADGSNSLIASFLAQSPPFMIILSSIMIVFYWSENKYISYFVLFLTLPAIAVLFTDGRRGIIFSMASVFLIWAWRYKLRISVFGIVGLIIGGLPILHVISTFFQAARMTHYELGGSEKGVSLLQVFAANEVLSGNYQEAAQRALTDFTVRANSMNFSIEFINNMHFDDISWGVLTLYGFLLNIPSMMWPEKLFFLAGFEKPEVYLTARLGMMMRDESMPLPSIMFYDFGWGGIVIAPLFILLVSWAMSRIGNRSKGILAVSLAISAAILLVFNAELNLQTAINQVRYIVMIYLFGVIINCVLEFFQLSKNTR